MSRSAARRLQKQEAALYSPDFLAFWAVYPRKVKKQEAAMSWGSEHPDLPTVLAALSWQIVSPDWARDAGAFIPHPTTYINQHRWEDEKSDMPIVSAKEARNAEAVRRFVARGGRDAFSIK